MKYSAKFLILFITILFLIPSCDEESEIPLFKNAEMIDIKSPEDEQDDLNGEITFKYSQKDDAKYTVLAIFKEPIEVDSNNVIANWESCVCGTRTKVDNFTPGTALLSLMKSFNNETGDFTDISPTLNDGTYYWAVWALDEYGNLCFSSKQFSFTYARGSLIITY